MNYLHKKTVEDIDVAGKRVLVRCDFNVPLDENCNITDTKRVDESLKTINYLVGAGAKVILCSHLGRPSGKFKSRLSLTPVAKYLREILKKDVKMATDSVGESAQSLASSLDNGDILLLENLRFYPEEEQNDKEFSRKLASLAQVFVNDAFGTAHRAHASTVGVTEFLPAACGFLISKELKIMTETLENPKHPFVSILGGAKVSDKIQVIENLISKVDTLIIGGGMAYTFLKALGYSVGTSICENDKVSLAKDIMVSAKEKDVKLIIPVDNRVGLEYDPNTENKVVPSDRIPEGWMGLDIGQKTQQLFAENIKGAKTIVWNGPMGVSEWDNFASGTHSIAKAIVETDAVSIVGGGDSAAAVEKLGFTDRITHVSTGGGASLMLLEGKALPGIEALDNK